MIRTKMVVIVVSMAALFAAPATAHADFGLAPGSLSAVALTDEGAVATRAGSHPFSYAVNFSFNATSGGEIEGGAPRDIIADLPAGMIGNPLAVPRCSRQDFEGVLSKCPLDTQVGVVRATVQGLGQTRVPIFNLEPTIGSAAQLGGSVVNLNILQSASVRTEEGYGVRVGAVNIPADVSAVTETIWGIPADSSHDAERGGEALEGQGPPVKSGATPLPFLTLPTSCAAPMQITVRADSKLNPDVYVEQSAFALDSGGHPTAATGCDSVPFTPAVASSPSSTQAERASGLGFELKLPNKGLLGTDAITETEPVKTEVTLPTGITANPAAAGGLVGCSEAQYRAANGEPGQGCPDASKLGTLVARSPLLDEAIEGSVYLAQPNANKFGSLLALYIVAAARERGVLIKQAGRVDVDPATGQLTTTFDELPPVPYSSFELRLREGPRAPLITPDVCGEYTTLAKLYPFSDPGTAAVRTAAFRISTGNGGGACAQSTSQLPFSPALSAGTVNPLAGSYSPFVFSVTRNDGEQRLGSIQATLPAGLTGKLAGVPYCPEAGIAQAQARSHEGDGARELTSPSCPVASQVGIVNVGAGAGSQPYYVQGKAYLAGPYKGSPLSLVIITPALAGPFDLGVVAVRAALDVNETSAQIAVKSDPLPTSLHGIPLAIRSVSVQVDRSGFTLNPTNCEKMTVGGTAISPSGASASFSNRFQVTGCAGLGFGPSLGLRFKGGTTRTRHPALSTVLTFPKGGSFANIAKAAVTLPHSEIIDQAHVGNPCTRPQFAAEKCPKISVLGRARAWSPLLDQPLEGNVYFRANGGERGLPDVVADLRGQVHLVLVGAVDTVTPKTNPRIRTTFFAVPDAPVSKFVLSLKGGKEGLLVNSESLCRSKQRAVVRLVAQNGRIQETQPKIANACQKPGKSG